MEEEIKCKFCDEIVLEDADICQECYIEYVCECCNIMLTTETSLCDTCLQNSGPIEEDDLVDSFGELTTDCQDRIW